LIFLSLPGVVSLVKLISSGRVPLLATLNLAGTDLRCAGPVALAAAATAGHLVQLRSLNLGYNPNLENDQSVVPLLQAIISPIACPLLAFLILPGINLGQAHISKVVEVLRNGGSSLQSLRLENNSLGPLGAMELAAALSECPARIKELYLGYNRLQLQGARALARGFILGVGRSLVDVSLPGNRMSGGGVAELAHAIKAGWLPMLERLDLRNNDVGSLGATVLFDGMATGHSPSLHRMDLTNNGIGDQGFEALGRLLLRGTVPRLKELFLGYNDCGREGCRAMAEGLASGGAYYVQILVMEENPLEDWGVADLAHVFCRRVCPSLTELSIKRTGLTDAVVPLLAQALHPTHLPCLHQLKCSGNYFSPRASQHLAQACKPSNKGQRGRVALDLSELSLRPATSSTVLAEAWRSARPMQQPTGRGGGGHGSGRGRFHKPDSRDDDGVVMMDIA